MNTPTCLRSLMLCAVLVAGPTLVSAKDDVTDRGYVHTTMDQQLVLDVLVRANRLLVNTGIRFEASWRQERADAPRATPVYLVTSNAKGTETPAAVPYGCRCVFVNPSVLADWVRRNSEGTGRLELDRGNFLIFVLLHEAGHLHNATSAAVFNSGEMSQLNVDPGNAKSAEEDADNFAAELLRRYSRQEKANDLSLDANWVVSELAKLSWNMQAYRTLDEFGAFAVGKPSVYFDSGYTHPNLAWRILRVNDLIQQTKETRYLLDAFKGARQRGDDPQLFYQRK